MSKRKAAKSGEHALHKSPERALRKSIVAAARLMSSRGLSPGRSGNISARCHTGMLITPTAMPYDDMRDTDIVYVDDDPDDDSGIGGSWRSDGRAPSSEWRFHLAAYHQRPDQHAIVHTHSLNATALACAHKSIPPFHYMVAVAGGRDIPCVPYATFGTDALARLVAQGLSSHNACLMANHGQIAIGCSVSAALDLAFEVETLAAQYIKVLQLGEVHLLDAAEMDLMIEKFKTYGKEALDAP